MTIGKIIAGLDVASVKKEVTPTEPSDQVGVSLSNLSVLKTNKAKAIRFSILSEICRVLSCGAGDLLRYEEGEDNETNL